MNFHLRFIVMRCFNIANCSGAAIAAAGFLLGFTMQASTAAADPKEVGVWYDDTGKGAVKIEICTPTTLCGKIYWLKEPMADDGQPKIDRYNPEPSKRTRPICGLPVLGDLEKISDGGFDNGWVYDPKQGKSFSVALDLLGPDTLKVTGYKGMRFLGKSFIWTRAPSDLPSCDSQAALPPVPVPVPAVRKKQASNAKKSKTASGASKLGAADIAKSSHHKKKKVAKAAVTAEPPPVASNP
ncbi:DUF2147 domain-containing protein [Hyphomicrobium sp. B1]|uniref:DUF2147 domain-containing protein n=1 Tax=unclassified Hyphomicrobium TaxID=2619925 RepID=UPI000213F71F|nr:MULTISPECIES: DUF2147 domain-containing protein [unclassified Hyphomicrobium]CCB67408.1 conserved exported protein of unknown function [Hyphomicrobium sp. MC1]HVX36644.1 DUF2147 domain-containing protein [Hyphomicrobium sp.]